MSPPISPLPMFGYIAEIKIVVTENQPIATSDHIYRCLVAEKKIRDLISFVVLHLKIGEYNLWVVRQLVKIITKLT